MITDIHHMSFTVNDMEGSVTFYRDILGMEVVRDTAQAGV
jgi:catechol 2,3-dioxygenase-like lactoylglutathione lyase family enzyme